MAEPTSSPSLPSTADAVPYVPVSWLAVAALAVAVTFGVTLLILGVVAFTNKKPLLEEWLLFLPAVAVVLSFAARRVIRNSEGTRTGENLATYAWWIALVLGLCYIAYWAAFDFAIRRDARTEVKKWAELLAKGTDDDIDVAFLRTIPPGQRQGVSATDKYQIRSRFRDELLSFRSCDLLRVAQRNKNEMEFVPDAVTWAYKPGSIDCVLNGKVVCAEGTFPMTVPLRGVEGVTGAEGGGGGRQWQIARPQGGNFFDQARVTRTHYGWLVARLEAEGGSFGKSFVAHLGTGRSSHLYVYRAFVAPGTDPDAWAAVAADRDPNRTVLMHLAFAAPTRVLMGDEYARYTEYMGKHFYKGPGGAEPSPEQKARFLTSWTAQGLRPAGDKLRDTAGGVIDKDDVLTLTDSQVEVRVPVELPVIGTGKIEAARGRLLVVADDPALLAELKQLRTAAKPAEGTASPPPDLGPKSIKWRVVRVESDMQPVNIDRGLRAAPGEPGVPGMPGGGPLPGG